LRGVFVLARRWMIDPFPIKFSLKIESKLPNRKVSKVG